MAWLNMGSLGILGTPTDDYVECRGQYPAGRVPGALTVQDPCWTDLIAMRRYEGRDPLGRDIDQSPPRITKPRSVSNAETRMRELGTNMDPISRPTLPSGRPDRIGEVNSSEDASRIAAMAATLSAEREIEILKARQRIAQGNTAIVAGLGGMAILGFFLWTITR